ncbi:MAG TPA: dTDP-4-dehydrorhamnose 3,5-epimerase [Solirubrobacteraceae bacterium]|nr:dTDP-4-dehydrorhamnose 3,5-epimerase [Solirubrobacteraceae bacterium]
MRFTETDLPGAFVVEIEPRHDERGFFARTFDARLLEEHGMNPFVAQRNTSVTRRTGAIRGMHYQLPPAAETKFIRCVRGAIRDVIVDLREDSPTYMRHIGVDLTEENRRALYVPALFAHGFQTLADDTEVDYLVSEYYTPGVERGLRHDDPALGIEWPLPVTVVSDKDRAWPLLEERAAR